MIKYGQKERCLHHHPATDETEDAKGLWTPNRPSSNIHIQHTSIPAQDAVTCLQANTNTACARAHYTGKGAPQFNGNQCPLAEAWVKSHTEEGKSACLPLQLWVKYVRTVMSAVRMMRIDAKGGKKKLRDTAQHKRRTDVKVTLFF